MDLLTSGKTPIWGTYLDGLALELISKGYDINLIFPDDYGVHFYADTVFTRSDLIESNPDLVLRFLRASLKGWNWAVENINESAVLSVHYDASLEPEHQIRQLEVAFPLIYTGEDHIGWMKAEVWREMANTLYEQELLKQPVDITRIYTMQFLNQIYGDQP